MSESKDQAGEPVDRDDVEQAPAQGETPQAVPQTRAEHRAVTGEQPVVEEPAEAAPAADEPAAEAADEPATEASAEEPAPAEPAASEPTPAPDSADEPAPEQAAPSEQPEPAAADEPDYEALAAELDRLEADTAAAAPVAPGAPEPQAPGAKDPWFEPAKTETFQATEPVAEPEPAVTPSEPAAPAPIFVQAPEPPKKRGNRGAAGLIGLPAAISFAVLYLAASAGIWWFYDLIGRGTGEGDIVAILLDTAQDPAYWGTVIAFWLAFWLLGAFVNRARWWSWVVLGILVALLTYVGHLASLFLAEPFWMITRAEGIDLLIANVLSPIALAALILAREVTIWFGAWVSKRGARVAKENQAAQDEYESALASGPQAG